jgi:hypothetical protein
MQQALTSFLRVYRFVSRNPSKEDIKVIKAKFKPILSRVEWCNWPWSSFMPDIEEHNMDGGYVLFIAFFDRQQESWADVKPRDVVAIAAAHWNSENTSALHLDLICSGVSGAGSRLLHSVEKFALETLEREMILLESLTTAVKFYQKEGYVRSKHAEPHLSLIPYAKVLSDKIVQANTERDDAKDAQRHVVHTKWAAAAAAAAVQPPTVLGKEDRFDDYKVLRLCRPQTEESGDDVHTPAGGGSAGAADAVPEPVTKRLCIDDGAG